MASTPTAVLKSSNKLSVRTINKSQRELLKCHSSLKRLAIVVVWIPLPSVAYRPRFGGDSQARTPQLVWASWRETQPGRDQLERFSWTGTRYSHETGTRPTEFSYVYKYQLVTQAE
jgi:hypothetical protein